MTFHTASHLSQQPLAVPVPLSRTASHIGCGSVFIVRRQQHTTMSDIHFDCPKCSQTIDAPQEMAAQLINCPACKETIEVPVRSRSSWKTEPAKLPKPAFRPPPPAPATSLLTKCPSCRSDVSTEAAACPKCGHQFKYAGGINLKDPIHVIGLIICAVIIIGVILYIFEVAVVYR